MYIHAFTTTINIEIGAAAQWRQSFELRSSMVVVPQLEEKLQVPLGGACVSISTYLRWHSHNQMEDSNHHAAVLTVQSVYAREDTAAIRLEAVLVTRPQ